MPHDCNKRRTPIQSLRIAERAHEQTLIRPGQEATKLRAEIDQDNSMVKSPPRTRFFAYRTSEHTLYLFMRKKKARNYVPVGRNCQNTAQAQGIFHVAIQDRFHAPLYLLLGLTTDHAVL